MLEALAAVRQTALPEHLLPISVDDFGANWRDIATNPTSFLQLGLCSRSWLEASLPAPIAASDAAPLAGDALVHLDVRSDNLCFRGGRAVLIDWHHACLANADLDIAGWLPSLHAEGGPAPERILRSAPELAAWLAGYFCSHAGEAPVPGAPHVRPLQLRQAQTASPWAARALGLPALRSVGAGQAERAGRGSGLGVAVGLGWQPSFGG